MILVQVAEHQRLRFIWNLTPGSTPMRPWSPVLMGVPHVLWGVGGYERAVVGKEA